jgi:hypothetical protein
LATGGGGTPVGAAAAAGVFWSLWCSNSESNRACSSNATSSPPSGIALLASAPPLLLLLLLLQSCRIACTTHTHSRRLRDCMSACCSCRNLTALASSSGSRSAPSVTPAAPAPAAVAAASMATASAVAAAAVAADTSPASSRILLRSFDPSSGSSSHPRCSCCCCTRPTASLRTASGFAACTAAVPPSCTAADSFLISDPRPGWLCTASVPARLSMRAGSCSSTSGCSCCWARWCRSWSRSCCCFVERMQPSWTSRGMHLRR